MGILQNSLDRTIRFLIEREFIVLSSVGLKNEKFYQITSKPAAKMYRNDLRNWKLAMVAINTLSKKKIMHHFDNLQRFQKRIKKQIEIGRKKNKFAILKRVFY